jgi:hypothetical protein
MLPAKTPQSPPANLGGVCFYAPVAVSAKTRTGRSRSVTARQCDYAIVPASKPFKQRPKPPFRERLESRLKRSHRSKARARRPGSDREAARHQRRRRRARAAKPRRAAKLLAQGLKQLEAAAALEVSARTLRNWSKTPALQRALVPERARAELARTPASPAEPEPAEPQKPGRQARRRASQAAEARTAAAREQAAGYGDRQPARGRSSRRPLRGRRPRPPDPAASARASLGRVARLVCRAPPPLPNRPTEPQRRSPRDRAAARGPGSRARPALPAQASAPALAGRAPTPSGSPSDSARQAWGKSGGVSNQSTPGSARELLSQRARITDPSPFPLQTGLS